MGGGDNDGGGKKIAIFFTAPKNCWLKSPLAGGNNNDSGGKFFGVAISPFFDDSGNKKLVLLSVFLKRFFVSRSIL